MPTQVFTTAISAMAIAGAITVSAQNPNPQTQPTPQSPRTTQPQTQQPQSDSQRQAGDTASNANAAARVLTLTGCVQAEKDVPGRRPSVTERAGLAEDYILTNVKMAQGGATSGIGLGSMYQLKGGTVKESELKDHLGHHVEVTGSLEPHSDLGGGLSGRQSASPQGTTATTASGNSNLPNFEATSIRMIAATCPAQ